MKRLMTVLVICEAMTRSEYNIKRGWELPENENGDDLGYLLINEDGSICWKPKEEIEKYSMPCESFYDRLLIEQKELNTRMVGLDKFSTTEKFKELPKESRQDLLIQLNAMKNYSKILGVRIMKLKQ